MSEITTQRLREIILRCQTNRGVDGTISTDADELSELAKIAITHLTCGAHWAAEIDRLKERLDEANDELRCPACGCATPEDAEANECGCDAPVCSRDGGATLAEHYIDADGERKWLRRIVETLPVTKDGVPITPGMTVFFINSEGICEEKAYGVFKDTYRPLIMCTSSSVPADELYFERKAAEARMEDHTPSPWHCGIRAHHGMR